MSSGDAKQGSAKTVPPATTSRTTGDKSPNEAGLVVRNGTNPLALPVTRMKIGWYNVMPADITRFRLWIPTNSGGVLTLGQEGGGTVDLERPYRKVIQAPAKQIVHEFKAGEYGEHFVIATGKAGEKVACNFVQTGTAHEGPSDSDPFLIPWNFWYWPTAKNNPYWNGAGDLMAKYGRAFGKDPDECRKAEHDDHSTAPISTFPYWNFEGHCHLAAPASVLFEQPTPVTFNGESFDAEDLKYLALEFWGNFGQVLPGGWDLQRGPGKLGRLYLPAFFKPSDAKTEPVFVDHLKLAFGDPEHPDDPKLDKDMRATARSIIQQLGGEVAFSQQIDKWMGELAAECYQFLIDWLRLKKHPIVANMRAYEPEKGPEQVWNHVVFYYHAEYQEYLPFIPSPPGSEELHSDGPEDEKNMTVTCEMRVNADLLPPLDSGLPAEITDGHVVPNGISHSYVNNWRLQFDDAGKIVTSNERNEWYYVLSNTNDQLYSPTRLRVMDKPSKTRSSESNPLDLGNKFVDAEIVRAGLLTLRKRYR